MVEREIMFLRGRRGLSLPVCGARVVWDMILALTTHSLEPYSNWYITERFQSQVDGNLLCYTDVALMRAKQVGDCNFRSLVAASDMFLHLT